MTERKPPGTSFTSWIDQQIAAAQERGAFDNLPGAGKPIPPSALSGDEQVWLRDFLRREGVPAEELLPTPLKLRKEIERLPGTVADLGSEEEVREIVRDLNQRITHWRRFPEGPPIFLRLVNADDVVGTWRAGRAPALAPEPVVSAAPAEPAPAEPAPRRRWRRKRRPDRS